MADNEFEPMDYPFNMEESIYDMDSDIPPKKSTAPKTKRMRSLFDSESDSSDVSSKKLNAADRNTDWREEIGLISSLQHNEFSKLNDEKKWISENVNSVAADLPKSNWVGDKRKATTEEAEKNEKNQIRKNVNSVAADSLPKSNGMGDKQKATPEAEKNEKNQIPKNVNSVAADSLPKSNGKQIATTEGEKKIDSSWFVEYCGRNDSRFSPEEIVKGGMELVDGSKQAEMEEKWKKLKEEEVMVYVKRAEMEEKMKKLKEEELMVYVKRMELQRDQGLLVLEAISSSGN